MAVTPEQIEVAVLWKALDSAIWEFGEGFKELPDGEVWVRPHPKLLSVGEIATHVGFWEARSFLGPEFETAFSIEDARYYGPQLACPIHLPMGAAEVYDEVQRIHAAAKSSFAAQGYLLDGSCPFREGWSWRTVLEYQAFHIAYHAGQVYSARHLMGHSTVDN